MPDGPLRWRCQVAQVPGQARKAWDLWSWSWKSGLFQQLLDPLGQVVHMASLLPLLNQGIALLHPAPPVDSWSTGRTHAGSKVPRYSSSNAIRRICTSWWHNCLQWPTRSASRTPLTRDGWLATMPSRNSSHSRFQSIAYTCDFYDCCTGSM